MLHRFHYSNPRIWSLINTLIKNIVLYWSCMHLLALYFILELSYVSYISRYHHPTAISVLRLLMSSFVLCVFFSPHWLCWCSLCNICVDFPVPLWNAVLLFTTCCTSKKANISERAIILMKRWMKINVACVFTRNAKKEKEFLMNLAPRRHNVKQQRPLVLKRETAESETTRF